MGESFSTCQKKGGITGFPDEKKKLIAIRPVTGWRVCMDYRKIEKNHFPIPFMDQMLDRIASKDYYYFFDGYIGYNRISITSEDNEKKNFTYPYGIFMFKWMHFSLCNAPIIFQWCMLSIFPDMVEDTMEVFMDNFSVIKDSFKDRLAHLVGVLKRCKEKKLVLN